MSLASSGLPPTRRMRQCGSRHDHHHPQLGPEKGVPMSRSQPIDVRDMAIVHRTFRNAYEESGQLVRARPTPSPGRVTFLADHIDFGLEMLHHHHASEDLLLYPLLLERVPEQAAMTDEVSHEHQVVQTALDRAVAA